MKTPLTNFVYLLVVVLSACTSPTKEDHKTITPAQRSACAAANVVNESVIEHYWKPGTFEKEKSRDDFRQNWFSTQLCAMDESPISRPDHDRVIIRFLWLRSFQPGISIRVENAGGSTFLVATELSGKGGYLPGIIARQIKRELSSEDWNEIKKLISSTEYWLQPTSEDPSGLDGSEWVIEIVEKERHHMVDRWEGGEIKPLGEFLIDLSQLNPKPK